MVMPRPDEILDSRAHQNGAKPLPLFRPEAILHQQQKSYGEIILIRPLSLTLLTGSAVLVIGLVAAFLVLGRYTEKVRVSGALAKSNDSQLRAELYIPGRWLASVQPGTRLSLRCRACPSQLAELPATVLEVSPAPSSSSNDSPNIQLQEPKYKVTVTLPPRPAQSAAHDPSLQTGSPVEAEISLGRKPLIKWLFQPSGS